MKAIIVAMVMMVGVAASSAGTDYDPAAASEAAAREVTEFLRTHPNWHDTNRCPVVEGCTDPRPGGGGGGGPGGEDCTLTADGGFTCCNSSGCCHDDLTTFCCCLIETETCFCE